MSQYKALIFDLDGTLVNTERLIGESFRSTILQVFGTDKNLHELTALVGIPLKEQMAFFAHKFFDLRLDEYRQFETPEALIDTLMQVYGGYNEAFHDEYIAAYDHMDTFLASATERGIPMAVATSKRHRPAERDLNHFNLLRHFDALIGADDVEEHKPQPRPLLAAMELLAAARDMSLTPEECIYIGDAPFDIQAAHAAGMLSVGVAYGMFGRAVLEEQNAAIIVETPLELAELFPLLSVY